MNKTYNSVVVCPQMINYQGVETNVLDIPFPIRFLATVDEEGNPAFETYREKYARENYKPDKSDDGRYIALFTRLSDLRNETAALKSLIKASGVTLGGEDFTQTTDNLAWYLNLDEYLEEFKPVNPMFKPADEITDQH